MAITLWNLFETSILCLNAICILHEERFLAKIGWSATNVNPGFGEYPSVKSNILNLIRSIRTVMRIPLIFLNSITIIKKLLLG
ncbi:hypothetical protein PGB90_006343 [Kerria lacca]